MTVVQLWGFALVVLSSWIDDDRIVKITVCLAGAAMILIPMLRPC